MGRCYAALHEYQQAEDCFRMCARDNPIDYDTRLCLAEVLEATNRKQEALEVADAVVRDRERHKPTSDLLPESSGALIPNRIRAVPTENPRTRRPQTDRGAIEVQLRQSTLLRWEQLEQLKWGMEKGNKQCVERWVTIAKSLIDDFRSAKGLFSSEKARLNSWFEEDPTKAPSTDIKTGKKRKLDEVSIRAEQLQNRLQEELGTFGWR